MEKLAFIYNPMAGTGRVRTLLGEIVDHFANNGFEVTLHPTTGRGDATEYARTRAAEFDRIVCAGGDGTLNEVISGLVEAERIPPLGYIPTGTTNDFARTLELPVDLMAAAECAAIGIPHPVDVGRFNGRTFVYIAAFGLFSDVSYTTPQNLKNALGHLAYVLSGISQLANVTSYRMKIECNGEEVEDDFIYGMVSDTISVGGMLDLNRDDVRINDGKLEALFIRFPQNLLELNEVLAALMSHKPCKNIVTFQSDRFTITSDMVVPWTLDGEFGGETDRVEIQVNPRAVSLITRPRVQALEEE